MAERPSESEMQVLAALWDDAPQTAADLTARVGRANGWTQATVKTLLARLVQKGAVAAEADGRRYLYRPAVDRDAAVGEESQRFVDRLFGAAELRLGSGKHQQTVRIVRTSGVVQAPAVRDKEGGRS